LREGKPENYSPFRPGMTATVDIITRKKNDIVGIPISAIVIKSDTSSTPSADKTPDFLDEKFEAVFVKEGNKAKLRVITTGIQDNQNIEVLSGLKVGETVITGPYNTVTKTLKDGDEVTPLEEKAPSE
jgi:HlyD family secretion protein